MTSASPPPKRIKLDTRTLESDDLLEDHSPRDRIDVDVVDERDEEVDNCSICLQVLSDRAVLPKCAHEFCFECIVVWSEQSRRCPLCSQALGDHLIHRIRSRYDYQKHFLPPLQTSPPPLSGNLLPLRAPAGRSTARRPYTRAERDAHRRAREEEQARTEADALERAILRRRWVYANGLYAKHVASNAHTRYRAFPTPAQFAASSDLVARATAWVRRDLRVWPNLEVEFLTTFIISLMKSIDIRSESAVKLLAEFLDMDSAERWNAEHFAHELYSYLRSPFRDLIVYDSVIQYDIPVSSSGAPGPSHDYGPRSARWRPASPPRSPSRSRSRSRLRSRSPGPASHRARPREDSTSPYVSPRAVSSSRSRSRSRAQPSAFVERADYGRRRDGGRGERRRSRSRSRSRSRDAVYRDAKGKAKARAPASLHHRRSRHHSRSRDRDRSERRYRTRGRERDQSRSRSRSPGHRERDRSPAGERSKRGWERERNTRSDPEVFSVDGSDPDANERQQRRNGDLCVDADAGFNDEPASNATPAPSPPEPQLRIRGFAQAQVQAQAQAQVQAQPLSYESATASAPSPAAAPAAPAPVRPKRVGPVTIDRTRHRTLRDSVTAHLLPGPGGPRARNGATSNIKAMSETVDSHTDETEVGAAARAQPPKRGNSPPALLARLTDASIPSGPRPPSEVISTKSQAIETNDKNEKTRASLSAPEIMMRTRARLARLRDKPVAGVEPLPHSSLEPEVAAIGVAGSVQDGHVRDGGGEGRASASERDMSEEHSRRATARTVDSMSSSSAPTTVASPAGGSRSIRDRLLAKLEKERRANLMADVGRTDEASTEANGVAYSSGHVSDDASPDAGADAEARLRRQAQLRVRLARAKREAGGSAHGGPRGTKQTHAEEVRVTVPADREDAPAAHAEGVARAATAD